MVIEPEKGLAFELVCVCVMAMVIDLVVVTAGGARSELMLRHCLHVPIVWWRIMDV